MCERVRELWKRKGGRADPTPPYPNPEKHTHHICSTAGPQRYVFEEMAQTAQNSFRFLSKQQPISYASSLATRMQKYPPQHFISGGQVFRRRLDCLACCPRASLDES